MQEAAGLDIDSSQLSARRGFPFLGIIGHHLVGARQILGFSWFRTILSKRDMRLRITGRDSDEDVEDGQNELRIRSRSSPGRSNTAFQPNSLLPAHHPGSIPSGKRISRSRWMSSSCERQLNLVVIVIGTMCLIGRQWFKLTRGRGHRFPYRPPPLSTNIRGDTCKILT